MNDLRSALRERLCIGTFVKIPRSEVVEIVATTGVDFIVCDMEHAQMSEEGARVVIASARTLNLPVVVRLPDPTQGLVNRLLEAGVAGIQMPRMCTAAEAEGLRSMLRFPPEGVRSIGRANSFAGWGSVPLGQYLDEENARTLAIGQFETRRMDRPCESITRNLDVAFIGPTDLSVDYGTPDDTSTPLVQKHIQEVEAAVRTTDTVMGSFVTSIEQTRELAKAGYNYLVISGDVTMLGKGAKSMKAQLAELPGRQ